MRFASTPAAICLAFGLAQLHNVAATVPLPIATAGTPYATLRARLVGSGYKPYRVLQPGSPLYHVNLYDRAEIYARYPEVEACGGTGLADCEFLLSRGHDVVIVHTTGEHANSLKVAELRHITAAEADRLYQAPAR